MGLLAALPIRGRHTLTMADKLPATGQEAIVLYLRRLGIEFNPTKWKWDLEVTGKTIYVGALAKRIDKWCYKNRRKLLDTEKNQVGHLVATYRLPTTQFFFDFDDEFTWTSGDFGDYGSCYFSYAVASRKALQTCGWLAMRFYENDQYERGIGRLLIHPQDGYAICMNGYIERNRVMRTTDCSHVATRSFASVLAEWLGLPMKPVRLIRFCGLSGQSPWRQSQLYANGGEGFVIGPCKHSKITIDDQPGVKLAGVT